MTVGEYRRDCQKALKEMNAEDPMVLCDIIFAHVLKKERSDMLARLDDEIDRESIDEIAAAIGELATGVPVQYVMGSCWFYNREIKVGKGCFIPRYDTEFLAAAAVSALPEGGSFADICSGSGCISAAIAQTLKPKKGYALELSRKALEYTEENLKSFENIAVRRFDALDDDDYIRLAEEVGEGLDVVVSNPPYIPTEDIVGLDVQVQCEPEIALDGGEDGLKFYREIVRLAPLILKENGTLLFEVGYNQADDVCEIMENAGFKTAKIKDDAHIERVVLGKKY